MLSRIFRIPDSKYSVPSNDEYQNVLPTFLGRNVSDTDCCKVLIGGPHGSGRTSLLFSLAVTLAEEGKDTLFVCPRKVSRLPALPEGEQMPSTSVLSKIHMVYLESREEFLKYMASVHLKQDVVPHCVIVDDLDSYVFGAGKNEELSILARLLAFTLDAYNFELEKLKKENGNASSSMLVISITIETSGIPFPRQSLYERWIDHILRIKPRRDCKSGEKEFELSVLLPQCKSGENDSLIDVKYFLNDKHFCVSEIVA